MNLIEQRLFLSGGGTIMDRISESLLNEFSRQHSIMGLPDDERFEHFAAYITIRRTFSGTFDTQDVVTGSGNDTGIDAIGILANGQILTDIDSFRELLETTEYLDVTFIFVQAERSPSFEAAKIGAFEFGILDLFSETPRLPRNDAVSAYAELVNAIIEKSGTFKRGNPVCKLYYVTTGKWIGDANLEARRAGTIEALKDTNLFRSVDLVPVGASELQTLYQQTKNAIARDINFPDRTVIPEINGVAEAFIGFLPAQEFIKLIQNEDGDMLDGLFHRNVRDWQDYNKVNSEIQATILSNERSRFVLMNNGLTIIASRIQATGNKLHIEDYQIVNGCQTSHALFYDKEKLDAQVAVPVRIIGTQDDEVIKSIIRSTNRQTAISETQFNALEEFPQSLELFFVSFPDQYKLYYERRNGQYDRLTIEKARIITAENVIRAIGSMFCDMPHSATKNFKHMESKVLDEYFKIDNKKDPAYTASFALYRLETLFKNGKVDRKFKAARFHILMALRMIITADRVPRFLNGRDIEAYCNQINKYMWEPGWEPLILKAVEVIDSVAAGNYGRDYIRTEKFTEIVKATLMPQGNTA